MTYYINQSRDLLANSHLLLLLHPNCTVQPALLSCTRDRISITYTLCVVHNFLWHRTWKKDSSNTKLYQPSTKPLSFINQGFTGFHIQGRQDITTVLFIGTISVIWLEKLEHFISYFLRSSGKRWCLIHYSTSRPLSRISSLLWIAQDFTISTNLKLAD